MAECVVSGDQLVVRMSTGEKVGSVRSAVTVPLSSIRSVAVVENTLEFVHGLRVGTGAPGATAVGTFTSRNARIFAVIHHAQHRGVRIVLEGAAFDEILLANADPESVVAQIQGHQPRP